MILDDPVHTATKSVVYVVDDDPEVGNSLKWLLETVGLEVRIFRSATEFLAIYDGNHPGCLILDVRMPEMSGLEVYDRLRKMGASLPVIIMTAYADVNLAVRAMKNGAIHFFEKPIDDQELLDQVQAAIANDMSSRREKLYEQQVHTKFGTLTEREQEVLDMVASGLSSKEIGQSLGVSFKTVEAHRAKIMRKMQADSIPQLIRQHMLIQSRKR